MQQNAKIFQGLPKHTCNVGSLMTIGWYPIECHIDILRLCFLWRIMVLPISSIYKLLLIRQLAWFIQNNTLNHGPMSTMFSTSMKYGLLTHIINATFYGKCMTILQWKRIVHDNVCRHRTASLKITKLTFKSLVWLDVNSSPKLYINCWWKYNASHTKQSKAISSVIHVLLNVYRFGKKRCVLCNSQLSNSLAHILFQCEGYYNQKTPLWNELIQSCPRALKLSLNSMNNDDKTKFMINCFYVQYNNEWDVTYNFVIKYVNTLVNAYYNATKDLQE